LIQPEYFKFASSTAAGLVIVGKRLDDCSRLQLIHKNPYWAFAKTSQIFAPSIKQSGSISQKAHISESARIGANTTIYPNVVVDDHARVGDHCVLYPGTYIGRHASIGNSTVLRANVVIEHDCKIGERVLIHAGTVIGSDGFGFAPGEHDIAKIPQVGNVVVGDDVEIGAGSTIDRAAMGETRIGQGCKLDSSVHVAHNVHIGDHSMVCGGAHIAGSAKLGRWNILAGASNVTNHVTTAERVTIGAMAGVTKSLKESGEYMGFPAVPMREWRRQIASVRRLESLFERVRKLEQLKELKDKE
jgi:UDP-3-O-[3-hydroxymyristoyl] glucosamine N-acyltransferase